MFIKTSTTFPPTTSPAPFSLSSLLGLNYMCYAPWYNVTVSEALLIPILAFLPVDPCSWSIHKYLSFLCEVTSALGFICDFFLSCVALSIILFLNFYLVLSYHFYFSSDHPCHCSYYKHIFFFIKESYFICFKILSANSATGSSQVYSQLIISFKNMSHFPGAL